MTDDRILELLKLNDHATSGNGLALAFGLAIANEAASEEREACAKICEEFGKEWMCPHTTDEIATLIRRRFNG